MPAVDTLRLVGIPGTNKVMAGELSRLCRRALGRRPPEPKRAGTGTLIYPFDPDLARLAACYQRTPSRALWDLYESRAPRLDPLYNDLRRAAARDRRQWLWDGASFSIRPRNLDRFAAGERQVVGAVKNALIEGAAARGFAIGVEPQDPDLLVAVRMHDDAVTVSIDLAGRAMHQRGYRRRGGAAPLRENLAAVLLMLARWDPRRESFLDPMAGSGTLAIEAALMARAAPLFAPPRRAALFRLPALAELAPATEPLFADASPEVVAGEIDRETFALAKKSAAAAGVERRVDLRLSDFRDLEAPAGPGLVLSNPPYGVRMGGGDLTPLYRDLGAWCRRLRRFRVGLLVANQEFAAAFGGRARVTKPLSNGSQRATFYLYDAGS